jgi:hypothetical protein
MADFRRPEHTSHAQFAQSLSCTQTQTVSEERWAYGCKGRFQGHKKVRDATPVYGRNVHYSLKVAVLLLLVKVLLAAHRSVQNPSEDCCALSCITRL